MAYNMLISRFVSSHTRPNMSLPNATKDTTEHPPKNAVAAPVNNQEKAADVDRKVVVHESSSYLLTYPPSSVSSDSTVLFRLSAKGVILPTARLTLP